MILNGVNIIFKCQLFGIMLMLVDIYITRHNINPNYELPYVKNREMLIQKIFCRKYILYIAFHVQPAGPGRFIILP